MKGFFLDANQLLDMFFITPFESMESKLRFSTYGSSIMISLYAISSTFYTNGRRRREHAAGAQISLVRKFTWNISFLLFQLSLPRSFYSKTNQSSKVQHYLPSLIQVAHYARKIKKNSYIYTPSASTPRSRTIERRSFRQIFSRPGPSD